MTHLEQGSNWKTIALATIWFISLVLGLTLVRLEIFLILAPLSSGIYLLFADTTGQSAPKGCKLPERTQD